MANIENQALLSSGHSWGTKNLQSLLGVRGPPRLVTVVITYLSWHKGPTVSVCTIRVLGRKNFYSNTGCRRVAGMRETRPWEPSEPTLTLGLACRRFAFSRNRVFLPPRTPQRLRVMVKTSLSEGRVVSKVVAVNWLQVTGTCRTVCTSLGMPIASRREPTTSNDQLMGFWL